MKLKINRRSFLQALITAGASYALPVNASQGEVDQLWKEAQSNPWFFTVNQDNTLIDANVTEPEVWSDLFDINPSDFKSAQNVIDEVDNCIPLSVYLDRQLAEEIKSQEEDLQQEYGYLTKQEMAIRQKKVDTLKGYLAEHEEPRVSWIELEGDAGVLKFKELVKKWLEEPIDWMQSEWFPLRSGTQGAAFGFFQDQPLELLNKLGVVIVEGEHPGSSYYAAELRNGIDLANQAAESLELPFRFKNESA